MLSIVLALSLAASGPSTSPAIVDPAPDAAHPAGQAAFVLPVGDGALNCVMYTAAGATPHPTLLLLHGFPGNEQNLDLAQAARRAGWNVLTLHYRGSWGSPGRFSLADAAADAHAALAFLRSPAAVARYRIDGARIAVAGHSMGGFMAADAAADDARVAGLFLIDPWNIADTAAALATDAGRADWHAEAEGDLPPLSGTSEAALGAEMRAGGERFSLPARIRGYGDRPLAIYGATRGIGDGNAPVFAAAHADGRHAVTVMWATDHPFSDKRIALSEALVAWLQALPPR